MCKKCDERVNVLVKRLSAVQLPPSGEGKQQAKGDSQDFISILYIE